MYDHWLEEEIALLQSVPTYEEAADIALAVLARMKERGEVVVVCGPITTGGLGTPERNRARFREAIERAKQEGLVMFNQVPFQQVIERLSRHDGNTNYDMNILEIFYRKVFESGYITRALFLPDWQSSRGATWERALMDNLGITVEDYPHAWL